jgi:hypothetical protein
MLFLILLVLVKAKAIRSEMTHKAKG